MKKTSTRYIVTGTGGELFARASKSSSGFVTSVSIDSRQIGKDCLFFCIIGERRDAHDFLPDVCDQGCHNVVVSDVAWAERMKKRGDVNVILVDDTSSALMKLAKRYMDDWPDLIRIGITGSVGKTSTKEFIYSALKNSFRTGKTKGNLNSQYGIPLTVFDFEEDIEVAVIEMGAGYDSHMEDLSMIVRPDIAVITTIGTSHLEVFGTREKLLEEKLKITSGFGRKGGAKKGVLIVDLDCDILTRQSVMDHSNGEFKLLTVGTTDDADYMLSEICDSGIDGVKCMLEVNGHQKTVHKMELPVIGAHNLVNAAEAVAAGSVLGVDAETAIEGFHELEQVGKRLETIRMDKYTVINDTYNASPESMKAALNVLSHSRGGRRVAVLGSMFELGDDSRELHYGVGAYAVKCGIDMLVTIGENAEAIADGARDVSGNDAPEIHSFDDKQKALEEIKQFLRRGDLVLVKASRSMALEDVVAAIAGI